MEQGRAEPIVSSRVFLATPADVFAAFADPASLAQWWGPAGFTNLISEFDLQPGGRWLMVMQSPGGDRYPMEKRFVEVLPDSRVVFDHVQAGHDFRMTLQFDPITGGTRLTWTMDFADPDEAARLRSVIEAANEQNFDRLAAFLDTRAGGATS
jgi:uncharacterized protein YndB with AHSA1/START domain